MKLGRILVALGGLVVAAYLVLDQGLAAVFQALRVAGLSGLGAITLLHALPILLCGIAWWLLLRRHSPRHWLVFTWLRWIRDGIDGVLPILPASGALVGMRILALEGRDLAGASIVVDLTAELLSQALFAGVGFIVLVTVHPAVPHKLWILLGVSLVVAQVIGFHAAQRRGLFRLIERSFEWLRKRKRVAVPAAGWTLHDRIVTLYDDWAAFFLCFLLHFMAWLLGGVEAWLGLRFMGGDFRIADVLAIEGLVYALRSVLFFVPLGAGVQEGGYMLIGGLLGLPPDLALAVSLLKRGRDLLLGIPALAAWQIIEVRQLRRGGIASDAAAGPGRAPSRE